MPSLLLRRGQYTLFMELYGDARRMAPYLMDTLLPRIRAGRWVGGTFRERNRTMGIEEEDV